MLSEDIEDLKAFLAEAEKAEGEKSK